VPLLSRENSIDGSTFGKVELYLDKHGRGRRFAWHRRDTLLYRLRRHSNFHASVDLLVCEAGPATAAQIHYSIMGMYDLDFVFVSKTQMSIKIQTF
jgi:hypothetical protein